MTRYFLIAIALVLANTVNAAQTGADWWKNCPGPACPARDPGGSYENVNKAKESREPVNHEKSDKDRDRHEKPIKNYEKDERTRDIDR